MTELDELRALVPKDKAAANFWKPELVAISSPRLVIASLIFPN